MDDSGTVAERTFHGPRGRASGSGPASAEDGDENRGRGKRRLRAVRRGSGTGDVRTARLRARDGVDLDSWRDRGHRFAPAKGAADPARRVPKPRGFGGSDRRGAV